MESLTAPFPATLQCNSCSIPPDLHLGTYFRQEILHDSYIQLCHLCLNLHTADVVCCEKCHRLALRHLRPSTLSCNMCEAPYTVHDRSSWQLMVHPTSNPIPEGLLAELNSFRPDAHSISILGRYPWAQGVWIGHLFQCLPYAAGVTGALLGCQLTRELLSLKPNTNEMYHLVITDALATPQYPGGTLRPALDSPLPSRHLPPGCTEQLALALQSQVRTRLFKSWCYFCLNDFADEFFIRVTVGPQTYIVSCSSCLSSHVPWIYCTNCRTACLSILYAPSTRRCMSCGDPDGDARILHPPPLLLEGSRYRAHARVSEPSDIPPIDAYIRCIRLLVVNFGSAGAHGKHLLSFYFANSGVTKNGAKRYLMSALWYMKPTDNPARFVLPLSLHNGMERRVYNKVMAHVTPAESSSAPRKVAPSFMSADSSDEMEEIDVYSDEGYST